MRIGYLIVMKIHKEGIRLNSRNFLIRVAISSILGISIINLLSLEKSMEKTIIRSNKNYRKICSTIKAYARSRIIRKKLA